MTGRNLRRHGHVDERRRAVLRARPRRRRKGRRIRLTLTLFEGRGPGDPICIEIAETKQTQVDLGEVAPGTYTITDGEGGAAPIEVTVS